MSQAERLSGSLKSLHLQGMSQAERLSGSLQSLSACRACHRQRETVRVTPVPPPAGHVTGRERQSGSLQSLYLQGMSQAERYSSGHSSPSTCRACHRQRDTVRVTPVSLCLQGMSQAERDSPGHSSPSTCRACHRQRETVRVTPVSLPAGHVTGRETICSISHHILQMSSFHLQSLLYKLHYRHAQPACEIRPNSTE